MQRFPAIAAIFLLALSTAAGAGPARRYLWLVRDDLVSEASIDRMLELAVEAGATGVMAQVVGRAEAYYDSSVLPLADAAQSFDPLQYLVERGRPLGLEIHAWVNAFLVWSAPWPPTDRLHVWHSHPDWFMADRLGMSTAGYTREQCEAASIVGATLSPAVPAVRAALAEVACEIAEHYDVDGIHLDYIRYPNTSFGYEYPARAGYFARTAVDPRDLSVPRYGIDPVALSEACAVGWGQWRRERVTETVSTVRSVLRSRAPSVLLSCAVMADPFAARETYLCDWPHWLELDLVDFVCPMAYSTSPTRAAELARLEIAESPRPESVVHGIGVYNQTVASASTGALEALELGAGGLCVFSLNTLTDSQAGLLRALWGSGSPAPHPVETSLLHQVWVELPLP